jgi:bifunctional DNA-binding transcriptional regulator/antitoxin component of YhaV-PrlF toxin-antitoxin module
MVHLVATSPVGKNGQTVIPAPIRHMFGIRHKHQLVGFFLQHGHIEIAPVTVNKADYSAEELKKIEKLANQKQGVSFKNISAAKIFLKRL